MEPTFKDGDWILAQKKSDIARYDVVIVIVDDVRIIKRVVGLPNETIKLEGYEIIADTESLLPWDIEHGIRICGYKDQVVHLEWNEIFVMGDNRCVSLDSEEFGPVALRDVEAVLFDWRKF